MYMSDGWPAEFPKVMRFVEPKNPKTALEDRPWGILAQNPDYQAAKRLGDTAAAARLVKYWKDRLECHEFYKKAFANVKPLQ